MRGVDDGSLARYADAIVRERHGALDHARKRRGHRLQRFLLVASFRPAEMREQDDLAALV